MVAEGSDRDVTNRCLELDERMSLVVRVGRASLAVGTEISIVADSTLVPVPSDVRLSTIAWVAKWSITVNADVPCVTVIWTREAGKVGKRLIDRNKSMARVNKASIDNAR
jgi:hypothetical protein